jgi:hypothetical protein
VKEIIKKGSPTNRLFLKIELAFRKRTAGMDRIGTFPAVVERSEKEKPSSDRDFWKEK